jgi:hypothetical protein
MNKALLWAGCCLFLFLAFLWMTSRPKPVRVRDLSLSQPMLTPSAKVVETERSVSAAAATIAQKTAEPSEVETPKALPDKPSQVVLAPELDLKTFASDEILALPFTEQKKFLQKNQLQDPEKFTRFRNIRQGDPQKASRGRQLQTLSSNQWDFDQ